jgi:hypothetical protein
MHRAWTLCLFLLALPAAAQPPPLPYQVSPPALERQGRLKKRNGAVLMGAGSAIAFAGTAMAIAGWSQQCHHCLSALGIAGLTTTSLGIAALVPGIVVYVDGGRDIDAAHCHTWSLRPALTRDGVGLALSLSR